MLPFNSNYFDAIYHIDAFYGWSGKDMTEYCHEILRVLKPGCPLICGMELSRLNKLAYFGVLDQDEFDPMRYLECLEQCGFDGIKVES